MKETYVTYKLWDGCHAPNNLESNGQLIGQHASIVSIDRDALLKLADEMDCGYNFPDVAHDYAKRIRKALGVDDA